MWWNTLLLAVKEIRRNTMRSFLTVLGIVIGVAAVIIMVTIGKGATKKVSAEISSLGRNLLIVNPGQRMGPGRASDEAEAFDDGDVAAVAREVLTLDAVAAVSSRATTAIYGNENWSTIVTGTTNDYLRARDWLTARGRSFTEGELRAGKAVCIIGETTREELFGGQNPLGNRIRLKKISCQVIGVLEAKGQTTMGRDQDDLVLIPLRAFQRRVAGDRDVDSIHVSVRAGASTDKARRDIERLLRERRHISKGEDDDFTVLDMKEIASILTGTTKVLTMLLGAVAAVSLVVGGIGIMNIMLVSVTERTREIGIRLAIGALEREVLQQFLVEAVVLSSLGGLLGVVLALVASVALAKAMAVPFVLNLGIVFVAFAFSAAVGVIFGYLPARRAATLDPIEALRHE